MVIGHIGGLDVVIGHIGGLDVVIGQLSRRIGRWYWAYRCIGRGY